MYIGAINLCLGKIAFPHPQRSSAYIWIGIPSDADFQDPNTLAPKPGKVRGVNRQEAVRILVGAVELPKAQKVPPATYRIDFVPCLSECRI
jgi:hypothetical protein